MNVFHVGLIKDDHKHKIENYTYIVSSSFLPVSKETTFSEIIENLIKSDFTHFTNIQKGGILSQEHLPTAGKEEKCS